MLLNYEQCLNLGGAALLRSLTTRAYASSQVRNLVTGTLSGRQAVLCWRQYNPAGLTFFPEQAAPPADENGKFMWQ